MERWNRMLCLSLAARAALLSATPIGFRWLFLPSSSSPTSRSASFHLLPPMRPIHSITTQRNAESDGSDGFFGGTPLFFTLPSDQRSARTPSALITLSSYFITPVKGVKGVLTHLAASLSQWRVRVKGVKGVKGGLATTKTEHFGCEACEGCFWQPQICSVKGVKPVKGVKGVLAAKKCWMFSLMPQYNTAIMLPSGIDGCIVVSSVLGKVSLTSIQSSPSCNRWRAPGCPSPVHGRVFANFELFRVLVPSS